MILIKKATKKDLVALVVLGLTVTGLLYFYGEIDWTAEQHSWWDLHSYIKMAQADKISDAGVAQPYCYRWLGPFLVKVLPWDVITSFRVLGLFFRGVFVYLFYFFLRSLKYKELTALAVVVIAILNKYFFGFLVWDYFQLTDSICLVLFVGLFWAVEARKWMLFGLLLAVGAATKEISLVMIPVAALTIWRKPGRNETHKFFLSLLPAIIVFAIIRVLSEPSGGVGLLDAFIHNVTKLVKIDKLGKMFVNVWAPISLVPLIFIKRTWAFFKDHSQCLLFLVLIYFASLFGSSTERLLAPAGIVVYWLLSDIISSFTYSNRLIGGLVLASMMSIWHQEIGRYTVSSQQIAILLTSIGLLFASLWVVYCKFRDRCLRKNIGCSDCT